MEYKQIVSVTGLGGLFQLVSTKNDGAIVRSLLDNSTRFISARLHNVTPLESIEVYTTGENVRLHEVFQKMKDNDAAKPDAQKGNSNDFKSYFKGIFPEIDEDRVYASDMKKMLKWFELLKANELLDFSYLEREAAEVAASGDGLMAEGEAQLAETAKGDETAVPLAEEALSEGASADGDTAEKPAKKARAKKAVAGDESEEEKPAKKTAARKKKEDE
jgi:hypothetical protein